MSNDEIVGFLEWLRDGDRDIQLCSWWDEDKAWAPILGPIEPLIDQWRAGRHLKNVIGLARLRAGIPDGEGHVTIHVTITQEKRA